MKKKLISLMMASAMLIPGAMLLGGCDHEHEYGEWETKTAATCQEAEVEVRKCACGAEETREGDPATGHTYQVEYTYDAEKHWRNANCGHNVTIEKSAHIDTDQDDICDVCKYGAVAKIGDKYFTSLQDAVNSIEDKTQQVTIQLTASKSGGGVIVDGQNVVFEMNGYAYTVDAPPVGSTGTETLGFQLLQGSTVTFKNGTLKTAGTTVKMLIQNYCDLTLEDVIVDATSNGAVDCYYALSNNCGNVVLKGETIIKADEGYCAFDLWFGLGANYDTGVTVTFDESFAGGVIGNIEYGACNTERVADWEALTKLVIKGGAFSAEDGIVLTSAMDYANIEIKGGVFDFDISEYVNADTHKIVSINDTYMVVKK